MCQHFRILCLHPEAGAKKLNEKAADGPAREEKPKPPPPNIGAEIELFVNQVDALAETLPLATTAIRRALTASNQELQKFFADECTVSKTEGGRRYYNFDGNLYLKYQRLSRRAKRAQLAQTLVPRGLLVALVSQFDAYIGALVKNLFRLRPEIVDSSGRTLTFSEMTKFDSIEAARDYIIEKEIDALLRESHGDQFEWLEKKFNISLRKDLAAWPVFIEVTERRNLFVHTDGIVSRQYLETCSKHSCQLPEGLRIGQPLTLAREYFGAAYECLLEIGVKLGQVLWRKIVPGEIVNADGNLIVIAYELISDGRYQLARALLDFGVSLKKHGREDQRLRLVVNQAQTYKWMGEVQKCKEIIDAEDWTAMNLKFKLAHAVLLDDFAAATAIAEQIGTTDQELDKHSYREWPLFKEFRKWPDFMALFERMFGEPLNKVMIQQTAEGSATKTVN